MPSLTDSESHTPRPKRVSLERRVSLRFKDLGGVVTGVVENVSPSGMFLRSVPLHPPGTVFDFEMTPDEHRPLIQGIAEVVWVRPRQNRGGPAGMGVRFLDLNPGSRALLYRILDERVPTPLPGAGRTPEEDGRPARRAPRASSYAVLARPAPPRPRRRLPPLALAALLVLVLGVSLILVSRLLFGGRAEQAPGPGPAEPAAAAVPAGETGRAPQPLPRQTEGPEPVAAAREEAPTPRRVPSARGPARPGAGAADTSPNPASTTVPSTVPASQTEPAPVPVAASEPPEVPAPPSRPAPSARPLSRLEKIDWRREGGELVVILRADGDFEAAGFNHLRLDDEPPRVLVRIRGVDRPFQPTTLAVGSPEVERIRIGHHRRPGGDQLHVVLDLTAPEVRLAAVEARGNRLVLRFARGP